MSALARFVTPPILVNGHLCLAGTFCINCCYINRRMENGASIFPNVFTQWQSAYNACSL